MTYLLEPFTYTFMLNAMFVSALVGAVCAFLSGGLAAAAMLFLNQRHDPVGDHRDCLPRGAFGQMERSYGRVL